MRQFDLKAEAEMRLRSDKLAAELARKRREELGAAEDGAQAPAPADATGTAGATDADDEDSSHDTGQSPALR
ncbi:hypothetical protein DY245_00525 [Streptomyces inhibens]|uniref:Uncharacterized protein n=1 Tax=Streptomyces inhibens TaxID=2293571 RepID=A0A371QBV0_STRIH|nr:hypothetical protein [Streptomyces inhibens]REK92172.1 hypothetical protein DY245_00525 [Streptomyces inhibens]